jgi:hypothetical protein
VKINAPPAGTAGFMNPVAASIQTPTPGSTIQALMALDSVISNWTLASNPVTKRLTSAVARGTVSLDLGRGRILPALNVSTRNSALQTGIVDDVVAGFLDIPSLFAGQGQRHPSQKVKTPGRLTGS